MPLAKNNLSRGRVQFFGSLTDTEIQSLVDDPELKILQASSPIEPAVWDSLNVALFSKRPEIELRMYGFYKSTCDLAFLSRLPNVRRFSADCLRQAQGIEHLASLNNLESLSIGIYSLESFDFLRSLPAQNLRELSLQLTKSKKPNLDGLARFKRLRRLYLESQQKNIEVVAHLGLLEDLTLRSITVASLEFLRGLEHLWSLDIKLGGTNDLSAINGMAGLKYLELWQVRGLNDVSVISTLRGLQFLFLQSLPNIHAVPDFSQLKALRRVYLENMKGLVDLAGVELAPALEEFIHVSAQGMEPTQYLKLLESRTLKRILVGFGNKKKNKILQDLATSAGIEPMTAHRQFAFA
jgi:hypothetical protein